MKYRGTFVWVDGREDMVNRRKALNNLAFVKPGKGKKRGGEKKAVPGRKKRVTTSVCQPSPNSP